MTTLTQGYHGVSTLVKINRDRFLTAAVLVAALYAGSFIALL